MKFTFEERTVTSSYRRMMEFRMSTVAVAAMLMSK